MNQDVIVGVATGMSSAGAVGIVRLSGDGAIPIVRRMFRGDTHFISHTVTYGHIMRGALVIDEVLVTVMRAPRSYTREDVVEISCHGGAACVRAVMELAVEMGARPAEPGEFTKRAFLNGRIDLSQAEAVMELITAKTDASRAAVIRRLDGGLCRRIRAMRDEILGIIANIEVSIDYPEHDMETINISSAREKVQRLKADADRLLATGGRGRILQNGIETVIIGRPNVGKSSLMNALLDEERAIVTDIAGTTRDALSEYVDIGVPLRLIDTAGLRDTEDIIEKIGVEKTRRLIESAELALLVLDGSRQIHPEELALINELSESGCKLLAVINKSDLKAQINLDGLVGEFPELRAVNVSAYTGGGLDMLCAVIKEMFELGGNSGADEVLISGLRQKNALARAAGILENIIETIDAGLGEDLVSMDLMLVYEALGEITGESVGEDLIDRIFSEFCLGK